MTNITILTQEMKAAAEKAKHAGEAPIMPFDNRMSALNEYQLTVCPDNVLTLVEGLEKAQQRIDELDSRTVKLPKLKMLEDYLAEVAIEERKQILAGVKLEFHRAITDAGIKVEVK